MRRITFALLLISVSLVIGACAGSSTPNIVRGDLLAEYTFSDPLSFEQGAYGPATLRVNSGVYSVDVFQGDNTLWWGQWGDTLDDVVIEVEASQITERSENAYGVMCRVRGVVGQPQTPDPDLVAILEATAPAEATAEAEATPDAEATAEAAPEATAEATPDAEATAEAAPEVEPTAQNEQEAIANEGDGYLFLIQGTGAASIQRARGRAVTPLVNWTQNAAIVAGVGTNRLRAICDGDYLALYVNDVLVAQTNDSTYRSGQVGLAASAANRLGVRIEFDNLMVYQARRG